MNILFSYKNKLDPQLGGTERVASMIADYLSSCGHNVYYLITSNFFREELNPPFYALSQGGTLQSRKQEVLSLCSELSINIVINESGIDDDVYLFEAKTLNAIGCNLITCVHFEVAADLISYYKYFCFSLSDLSLGGTIRRLTKICISPILALKDYLKKRKRYKYLLLNSSYVIVPALQIEEQFENCFGAITKRKVKTIPNPSSFCIKDMMKSNVAHKRNCMLYVGRLSTEKRVDKIIEAWRLVHEAFPDWELRIVGDGHMRQELESKVHDESIRNVHFMGRMSNLREEYEHAKYFLLTSDSESFSMVLLEALSYGCYPIIFDFPAAQQLMPLNSWGSRLEKHSARLLAREIRRCIIEKVNNENQRHDILNHLSKFDISIVGKSWDLLIADIERAV